MLSLGIIINGIENDCLAHSLYRFILLLSIILCIAHSFIECRKALQFVEKYGKIHIIK